MNWMLLATILVVSVYALRSLVDWLNWQHGSSKPLPAEFSSLMSAEKYREAQDYLGAQTKFRMVDRTFWTIALLVFLWMGGFAYLDRVAGLFSSSPLWQALIYFGALGALSEVINLPFSWYSTFVIEGRFGFNRSTTKTFLVDQVKGWALGILLGGPLLAAVLWFFLKAGDSAWIWVWAVLTFFQLVMGFLAPVLLMPLFNKFDPLPEGELKSAIEGYASSVRFQLQGIFTMDGSKRSTKANAFFTGLGRFRRIVLFDTLVSKHTVPELVAVLAHEVGHFKKGHIVKGLILSFVSSLVLLFLLSRLAASQEIVAALGFGRYTIEAGLTAAAWFFGPISLLLGVIAQAFSRKNEFEADAFAVETTGKGSELVDALKRLSADQLANFNPHPWKVWLEYSHPPLLQRVRAIRALG